jgi:hypothetical protein
MMGSWKLNIPKEPGVYQCKGGPTTVPFLSLNENRTGVPRGTTYVPSNGACEVKIKSVVGKIEGSFSAKLVGLAQAIHTVTDGYFVMPGYPDCGAAKDSGLDPVEKSATVAVVATTPYSVNSYYKCGSNGKLLASTAKFRDIDTTREAVFNGMLSGRQTLLYIENLYGAGTFQCGQAGSTTVANAKLVQMRLGDNFETKKIGSCTIKVDKWTVDVAEGSYEATLGFQSGATSVAIKGTFRTARYAGF